MENIQNVSEKELQDIRQGIQTISVIGLKPPADGTFSCAVKKKMPDSNTLTCDVIYDRSLCEMTLSAKRRVSQPDGKALLPHAERYRVPSTYDLHLLYSYDLN